MSKETPEKSVKTVTASDEVFDFTLDPEVMEPSLLAAYYRVRRAAMQRNDASLMPEGKKMTRAEIEELIGGELGQPEGPRPCCV